MFRNITDIQNFTTKNRIRPQHSKGQNFLIDPFIYEDMLDAASVSSNDLILEVGPGLGGLTDLLLERAKAVFAVELDKELHFHLKKNFAGRGNLTLMQADVLSKEFYEKFCHWLKNSETSEGDVKYKIVANLPYNISSIFIRTFLEYAYKPHSITLMLQKEVAERIVAKPGNMSLLALSVQYYADASIYKKVPADAFWPAPEVASAIIHFDIKEKQSDKEEGKRMFRLARMGFASKRKKLLSNLSSALKIKKGELLKIFEQYGLHENSRAQELSMQQWIDLSNYLNKKEG